MAAKTKTPKRRGQNKPGHVELLLWNIPTGLRNEFKAACARNGVSMRDAVVGFMGDYAARVTKRATV